MNPETVVRSLWERIEARDWAGLEELLHEDVVVDWPASRELIVGRDNFVAVQSEYPEGWSIRVLRILSQGAEVVSEVEVPHENVGIFRGVSIWTVSGGKIARAREYWTRLGGDERPAWREDLTTIDPPIETG